MAVKIVPKITASQELTVSGIRSTQPLFTWIHIIFSKLDEFLMTKSQVCLINNNSTHHGAPFL